MEKENNFFTNKLFGWLIKSAKWYGSEFYITVIGCIIILAIIIITVFAPFIAPNNPIKFVGETFSPPSSEFFMGTDNLGRDVFSRVIYGARVVLSIALLSSIFSAIVGVPLGLLSGFIGGKIDRILSLIMDSIYSFPGLILAIAMAALLGPGIINISTAIAFVYIPTYFRMSRGHTLSVKEELYIEAAKSLGAKS